MTRPSEVTKSLQTCIIGEPTNKRVDLVTLIGLCNQLNSEQKMNFKFLCRLNIDRNSTAQSTAKCALQRLSRVYDAIKYVALSNPCVMPEIGLCTLSLSQGDLYSSTDLLG